MIPDNYDLWARHEAASERWLAKRPKCVCCGEPIQEDYLYEINDELICIDCMNTRYRKETEYFVE